MGFSVGSYAKIWSAEDKGNYTVCQISISVKNKQTNQYERTFSAKVKFLGNAHKQRPLEGQRIKITNCDVTNKEFVKSDGTKSYPVQYVIYGYELQDTENHNNSQHSYTSMQSFDDDSIIPF